MNTYLKEHRRMFAILLGVAVLATAGVSAVYAQSTGSTDQTPTQTPPQIKGSINLQQLIQSQVKTSFVDAANSAAQAVNTAQGISDSKVISGSLSLAQGYIVYKFQVMDDSNKVYSVIVDAGNGNVLNTSQGHDMKFGAFGMGGFGGHHEFMMHKFHKGFSGNWQKSPSSGTTTSGQASSKS